MTPLLELKDFGAAYGEKIVLRSIGFTVPARGCTALLGPAGTGKSTLLRTLAGYNQAHPSLRTWGKVHYRSRALGEGNRPAMVMQKSQFLISTVWDNLVFEMKDRSRLTRVQQLEKITALMHRTGQQHLLERLDEKVVRYSAAQQRGIAILRQALSEPDLLMIDEPTTNLPEHEIPPLHQMIHALAQDRALLVVSHNQTYARRLADHVVLIANGITQECSDAPRFFQAPNSDAARHYLRTGSCPEDGTEDLPDETDTAPAQPVPALLGDHPDAKPASWGPRGFVWLIKGRVAGAPLPGIVRDVAYDLAALREVGVTRLVSLTEDPFPAALAERFGIACHASPIPDMQAPSPAQMLRLCEEMDDFLAGQEVLAVHCKAGLGRTGTVLAAYHLWRAGPRASAVEAIEFVRRLEPGMIQSQAQADFLADFAERLHTPHPAESAL
ncbi:MAG: ATP-binding cassette domain-containing protein [Curvibacter sp.]